MKTNLRSRFLLFVIALSLAAGVTGCAQRDCHGKKIIRLQNGVRI